MKTKAVLLFLLALLAAARTRADQYHYKDVLIGDRAAGLGGAFAGIADDPSGLYHNPAGLAFGQESYLSLSANAYHSGTKTLHDLFPGQNYVYRTQNFYPNFFGFTQGIAKGRFGFAIVIPSAEIQDQNDVVTDTTNPSKVRVTSRRFFNQDTTYQFGPGYAMEISPSFSVGVSLLGHVRINKVIDNQLLQIDPTGGNSYLIVNLHRERTSYGLVPKVGVQWMPAPKWAIGACLSKPLNLGGSGSLSVLNTNQTASGDPVPATGNFTNDLSLTTTNQVAHNIPSPTSLNLGIAYFASKTLLFSAQIDAYTAEPVIEFPVRSVLNWSLGTEYYLTDGLAARAGLFSNNAFTRPLDPALLNQPSHVDMLGTVLSLTLFRAATSLTAGVAYSWGTGQGQGITNSPNVQTMSQTSLTVHLSGSYQL